MTQKTKLYQVLEKSSSSYFKESNNFQFSKDSEDLMSSIIGQHYHEVGR